MRISTLQAFNIGVNGITDVSKQSIKTQQQISSGTKILTPADDPVATARIMQLEQELATRDQYQKNIDSVKGRLELEDGVLSSIDSVLRRVRELTVQAGNGGYTIKDRTLIANELSVKIDELADLMNSRDAGGEYIFSGFKGQTQPFVKSDGGNYTYHGDNGQRLVSISPSTKVPINDTGNYLFVDIPAAKNTFYTYANPNNTSVPAAVMTQGFVVDQEKYDQFYPEDMLITFNDPNNIVPPGPNFTVTQKSDGRVIQSNRPFNESQPITVSGVSVSIKGNPNQGDNFLIESSPKQNVLSTLGKLVDGLKTLDNSKPDAVDGLIKTTLQNIDNGQARLLEGRSQIGGRLNTLDTTKNMQEQQEVTSKKIISELKDLDYAEAASRLSFESFILQAAQQSYTKVANLSLFNFL